MSFVTPTGQPDWSSNPPRLSAVLWEANNFTLFNGTTFLATVDVAEWAGVFGRLAGVTAGVNFLLAVWFYTDDAQVHFVNSAGARNTGSNAVYLYTPVGARYAVIGIQVAGAGVGGAQFSWSILGTASNSMRAAEVIGGPVLMLDNLALAAGGFTTSYLTRWMPGRYLLNVITDAAAWEVSVRAYDLSLVEQTIFVRLDNTWAKQGENYPVVLSGMIPRVELLNKDGVLRHFWITLTPDFT